MPRWAGLPRTERGNADTADGEVRYVAVPITGDGVRGTFVVLSALGGERQEVTDAVRVAAAVLVSVLLLAAALAVGARRAASSRRSASCATPRARSRQTDLTRRIPVTGIGRDRRAGPDVQRDARPARGVVRLDGVHAAGQRAFVSDASHELRTPITIVRGHLELLGDDPEERRETVAS